VKLPNINKNEQISKNLPVDINNKKRALSRKCGSIEGEKQAKGHVRKGSNNESDCSTRPSSSTSL
jgi:hypothetical protein